MKMRANATCVLSTASLFDAGGSLFGTTAPKLEISTFDNREGLLVRTVGNRAANFSSIANGSSRGINVTARANSSLGTSIGIVSDAGGSFGTSPNRRNTGISALASGGSESNTGILSTVNSNTGANNFGSRIETIVNGTNNYGLFSNLAGSQNSGTINYGIYSAATGFNSFAGFFAASIAGAGLSIFSDASLKQDVKKETNMLVKLKSLNPVNYTFKQEREKTGLNLPTTLQHGFIAQELEKVFPELVTEVTNPIYNDKSELVGKKQIKAVNYTELISVLVSAINDLNIKVERLEEQNLTRTVVIDNTSKITKSEQDRLLANSYSLEQNRPNPFSELTSINYVLPENERNASILLLNLNGQLINEYKLYDTKGSITIDGSKLPKGIYLYSLVSNNLEISTKKMILK